MPSDLRQVKICEIWEPNEAEKVDPVLYASNVPLGGKARQGKAGKAFTLAGGPICWHVGKPKNGRCWVIYGDISYQTIGLQEGGTTNLWFW